MIACSVKRAYLYCIHDPSNGFGWRLAVAAAELLVWWRPRLFLRLSVLPLRLPMSGALAFLLLPVEGGAFGLEVSV